MKCGLPMETAPRDEPILLLDASVHYGDEPKGFAFLVARYRAFSPGDYRHPGGQWLVCYSPGEAVNPQGWWPLPKVST